MRQQLQWAVLFAAGCNAEGSTLRWSVVFENDSLRAATERVQAQVRRGECSEDAVVEWEESFTESATPEIAGRLSPGDYGLAAQAFDSTCRPVAQGCALVHIPEREIIEVTLSETSGTAACEVSLCVQGACVSADASTNADAADAPMGDAPTDAPGSEVPPDVALDPCAEAGCTSGENTWGAPTRTAGAPSARLGHSAVWTGTVMIVWGGMIGSGLRLNDGRRYDPDTDSWLAPTSATGAPSARDGHSAVWTGTEMIIWGGTTAFGTNVNTGARYDPDTGTWAADTSTTDAPSGRSDHSAVWTGTEMIVWGGTANSGAVLGGGGRYHPATDTWAPMSSAGAPRTRSGHSAVWTGTEMIVWGGADQDEVRLNTGGRYNPDTDSWGPATATVSRRTTRHSAVWTGLEMILWGGRASTPSAVAAGYRYDPDTDTWSTAVSSTGEPSERMDHTAVWTGAEMIVWGGFDGAVFDTGGRYTP